MTRHYSQPLKEVSFDLILNITVKAFNLNVNKKNSLKVVNNANNCKIENILIKIILKYLRNFTKIYCFIITLE